MNECEIQTLCDPGYQCINTHGGYECQDINECEDDNVCIYPLECRNILGSFDCADPCVNIVCEQGFIPIADGGMCTCDVKISCFNSLDCQVGSRCHNSKCIQRNKCISTTCPSGHECIENNGGLECHLIECLGDICPQICDDNDCNCNSGYMLSGNKCKRFNPCLQKNGGCAQICSYSQSEITCKCKASFTLNIDSKSCDIIQGADLIVLTLYHSL